MEKGLSRGRRAGVTSSIHLLSYVLPMMAIGL